MKTLFPGIVAVLLSWSAHAELQTVPYVDVSKYLGTWYQIARNPHQFEGDCYCSRQQLTARPDGKVEVYNTCNDGAVNGPFRTISGEATNEDPATNAKFSVDFHLPHLGQYWIIGLDPDYRYAVVSDPSMYSFYLLSKTPTLDPALYAKAMEDAGRQLDLSKVKKTVQEGCAYP
jgi:apolipoprotein D and lipocalin family protein